MNPLLIVGAAIFLVAVGLIVVYFVGGGSGGGSELDERLGTFVARESDQMVLEERKSRGDRSPSKFATSVNEAVADRGFAGGVATELARANLKLTVGEYMILMVTSILGTGVIFYIIMHGNPFLTLGGLVLGFFLPRIYVKMRQGRRLKDFNGQLGDSINLLANGLRSGYSLLQALDAVAGEMPAPISEEFQRVVREIGLGLTLEQSLDNMLRRIPSDDLDLLITAIGVQHEVGGNLAEILETISHTIRERIRIKGEIKVLTAQQTISGYVISFLPIGLGLILFAMNPDYMGAMFKDVCGIAMMSVAGIMVIIGFFAIRKIMDIEV